MIGLSVSKIVISVGSLASKIVISVESLASKVVPLTSVISIILSELYMK